MIYYLHYRGLRRRKERKRALFYSYFEEIIAKKFPKLWKKMDIQIKEAQKVPYIITSKRHTSRHITIKLSKVKDKDRILQPARKKQLVMHKRSPIRLLDFSAKALKAKRQWHGIFGVLKRKKLPIKNILASKAVL